MPQSTDPAEQLPSLRPRITSVQEFWHFCFRVLKRFFRHNVLILSGAIAYNALLSIIPLLGILLLFLSQFIDRQRLLLLLDSNLKIWLPGYSELLLHQVRGMLDHPEVFGGLGLLTLIFFSSIAFSVTGRAMQEIFGPRHASKRRTWITLLIPYIYICVVGLSLVLLIIAQNVLGYVSAKTLSLWGISIAGAAGHLWYLLIMSLMVCMIASLYVVMPGGNISFRRALLGGLSAALLWEVVRRILVWYFSNISMVNVIYGSFGAVIIVLLCFEIAAIIFLLGAEVIAELELPTLPMPEGPAEEVRPLLPPA